MCGNHGVHATIAPSVLASNFADLGNEVQRMMDNGAQWVHMGRHSICSLNRSLPDCRLIGPVDVELDVMDG